MKAATVTGSGVQVLDVPEPSPGPSEVKLRVRACGMNRADLMVASGAIHGKIGGAGTIVGMEFAGEVVDVGSEVTQISPGDRVMCSGAAGWAEYAFADFGRTAKIPDVNMSFETAVTFPVALQTMHDAVVTNGALQAGQSVLIQGASSGVGLMGMQIAKLSGASMVIGSSTDFGRRGRLSECGADLVVDSRDPAWVDQVLEATGGKGVDLIVDQISGYVMNQNLAATAIKGRIVNVGRLGGFSDEFNFDLHALRRITYVGVTFRTRTVDEIREITRRVAEDLGSAVADGTLSIPIDRVFALDRVNDAIDHMTNNKHFGKIVLSVS